MKKLSGFDFKVLAYDPFAKKEDEKYEDNNENFAKEYIEVCCEKCGNCILLDDIIHHLDS